MSPGPISQFNSLTPIQPELRGPVPFRHNRWPYQCIAGSGCLAVHLHQRGNGGFISVSNVIRKYEGVRATLTNCYFAAYAPNAVFASGSYTLTNTAGNTFTFFLNAANANIIGQPIPPFAWTITGPMGYFCQHHGHKPKCRFRN